MEKTMRIGRAPIACLLSLALALCFVPAYAQQAHAEKEGLFTYTVSNGEATITGCDKSASGSLEIPSVLGDCPVKSIGARAFEGCNELTSIVIADSVVSLGYGVAFKDCMNLVAVEIPDSVTTLGDGTFEGCVSLASIIVPDSVKAIGNCAFSGCAALESVVIPSSLKSINLGLFENCTSLASIDIPDSVESIGLGAFGGCTSLESIVIPSSVTSIERHAFEDCTSLASVAIPDSLTSIESGVFESCTALESIAIPDSITSIGVAAFSRCTGLASLVIPDSVEIIWNHAFSGCEGLTSVTIGSSVESIGYFAFSGCPALAQVTIPDSVVKIGVEAFMDSPVSDIYYSGTCSQWNEIEGIDEAGYGDAIVHCKDGNLGEAEHAPADNPPSEQPPADTPPADNPPADEPPVEEPPAEQPSVSPLENQLDFLEKTAKLPDLKPGSWYVDPKAGGAFKDGTLYLHYAVSKGLMQGYTKKETGEVTGFGPDDTLTRAQVATILYRYAVEDSSDTRDDSKYAQKNTTGLGDVRVGEYYTAAVNWCVENEVVTGLKDANGNYASFDPDGLVTREQLATMVGRLCMKVKGLPSAGTSVSNFKDGSLVSDWATEGVAFCFAKDIIGGYGKTGNFGPKDTATRAQMAKIIAVTARDVVKE